MSFLRTLGFESIAWSLRRVHCPVSRQALVLEVGSGGNPYPRANVLLDAYEKTNQRMERDLVRDRPMVLGLVEKLPFRDKSFDFIIASHVLEHSQDPKAFLSELMRVGKAGYIETPDAFFERINPFTYHYLEVTDFAGRLRIFRKPSWRHDSDVVDLYEHKLKKDPSFKKFLSRFPHSFHVRYYWNELIDYEIVNEHQPLSWQLAPERCEIVSAGLVRNLYLSVRRKIFSQNRRNKTINVLDMLRCTRCHGINFEQGNSFIVCRSCSTKFEVNSNTWNMTVL